MEHTLGEYRKLEQEIEENAVLILVLMEHTLGAVFAGDVYHIAIVLILVLMEHTLGETWEYSHQDRLPRCLNPCSNGTYSRRENAVYI